MPIGSETRCKECGSSFTKVRHVEQFCGLACHFWHRVQKGGDDDCWRWLGTLNSDGYGCVSYASRTLLAHRVSYELSKGPIGGMCVCHACDHPWCVNPNHLFLGTQADNVADRVAKGRSRYVAPEPLRGSKTHLAKLTEEQVLDIRRRVANGARQSDMAREYGLSWDGISRIIQRRTWRHL